MENFIESVLITYDNQLRVEYQSLAEFLRLLGVFVCEDMRCTKDSEPQLIWHEQDYTYSYTIPSSVPVNDYADAFKAAILEMGLQQDYFDGWYDKIFRIYQKCNLLQASVTLQYYRMKHSEIEKAGRCFEAATESIIQLMNLNPVYSNNPHLRYARLYCKQKTNLAYFLCEEPVAYYVNDLTAEGVGLTNDFPDFANAWVLLGLVYEISKDYVKDSIDAFQRAIDMVGEKPYVSSIYYWKGRRCEEHDNLRELQQDSYKKAYELMPKYRNIYKVARGHLDKEEWQDALSCFKECLQCLEKKGAYLDPLEQEYYFKVKIHLSYIYLQQKDYYQAIISGNDALNFRKDIEDSKKACVAFYYDMYGQENAQTYIDMTLARLSRRQIWRYLAIAYQESGMQDVADDYWRLYRG